MLNFDRRDPPIVGLGGDLSLSIGIQRGRLFLGRKEVRASSKELGRLIRKETFSPLFAGARLVFGSMRNIIWELTDDC